MFSQTFFFSIFLVSLSHQVESANLICYDSNTMEGDERPLTEQTCGVNSVCQYSESVHIDGYLQQCSLPSSCESRKDDSRLYKNVVCCTHDLCNAADGQPSTEDSAASASQFKTMFNFISFFLFSLITIS